MPLRLAIFLGLWGVLSGQELGDMPVINCPEVGLQLYPHSTRCDHFYMCVNGTLTHETCPNGLLFDGKGSVAHHCNYYWAVDCGVDRKEQAPPVSTENCPYAWGIFPVSLDCNTVYYKCEEGLAYETPCEPGLVYDDRTHSCNWPDLMENCNSEAVVGFRCPPEATGLSARFDPFPRYAMATDCGRYIVCVDRKPRLMGCGDSAGFNEQTLSCEDLRNLPGCIR